MEVRMRSFKFLAVVIMVVSMATSCDFCRSLVGKPTSKELEAMRQEQLAKKKALQDSINAANARAEQERLLAEAEAAKYALNNRFYVSLGAFRYDGNAQKFRDELEKKGYEIKLVKFKTGYDVVLTAGTDSKSEAERKMEELMELPTKIIQE